MCVCVCVGGWVEWVARGETSRGFFSTVREGMPINPQTLDLSPGLLTHCKKNKTRSYTRMSYHIYASGFGFTFICLLKQVHPDEALPLRWDIKAARLLGEEENAACHGGTLFYPCPEWISIIICYTKVKPPLVCIPVVCIWTPSSD